MSLLYPTFTQRQFGWMMVFDRGAGVAAGAAVIIGRPETCPDFITRHTAGPE